MTPDRILGQEGKSRNDAGYGEIGGDLEEEEEEEEEDDDDLVAISGEDSLLRNEREDGGGSSYRQIDGPGLSSGRGMDRKTMIRKITINLALIGSWCKYWSEGKRCYFDFTDLAFLHSLLLDANEPVQFLAVFQKEAQL